MTKCSDSGQHQKLQPLLVIPERSKEPNQRCTFGAPRRFCLGTKFLKQKTGTNTLGSRKLDAKRH